MAFDRNESLLVYKASELGLIYSLRLALREKCPNMELILVQIQENTDQK